jgi:hypothetical protein
MIKRKLGGKLQTIRLITLSEPQMDTKAFANRLKVIASNGRIMIKPVRTIRKKR